LRTINDTEEVALIKELRQQERQEEVAKFYKQEAEM
jgi:hypothetical protein